MKKLTTICALALVCMSMMAAPKYLVQATWEGTEPKWDEAVATATGATIVDLAKLEPQLSLSQWMAATGKANEVWIIAGTYYWTEPVKGWMHLRGGFAGTEKSLEERAMKDGGKAWEFAHETVITSDDGEGHATCYVNCNTGQGLTLDGLTFKTFAYIKSEAMGGSDNNYGGFGRLHAGDDIRNCQFIDFANGAAGVWGSYNANGDAVIENCYFENCRSGEGATTGQGGAISWKGVADKTLTVRGCEFKDCYATQTSNCGGAIFAGTGNAILENNIFDGCYGNGNGTVVCYALPAASTAKMYNNLIITTVDKGNVAKAPFYNSSDNLELINNTIINKTESNGTSLLYINGKALVMNNIVMGTQYCPKAVAGTAELVEKNNLFITNGNVNMNGVTAENNLFIKVANAGLAIDAAGVPTSRIAKLGADASAYDVVKDLKGATRTYYTPGCYEFTGEIPAPKCYLVQATWEGTEPKWSAASAAFLQGEIVDLKDKDMSLSQWVATTKGKANYMIAGTYYWTEFVTGALSLYGGFAGTELTLEDRAMKKNGAAWEFANETVITGDDGEGNPATALNQNTGQTSIYDGITFTKFTSTATSTDNHYGGIGRLHNNSSVKNCQFIDISCSGGNNSGVFGAYNIATDLTIENCLFKDCAGIGGAGNNGQGGVINFKDNDNTHTLNVWNCQFVDCYATQTSNCGGAIFVGKGNANIQNNIFDDCYGYGNGTVVCLALPAGAYAKVYNNLIITTTDKGNIDKAPLYSSADSLEFIHNTLINKTAKNGTSVLYINSKALVMNNIIMGTQYCPKAKDGSIPMYEKNNIFATDGNVAMLGVVGENNRIVPAAAIDSMVTDTYAPKVNIANRAADASDYDVIKDRNGVKRVNKTIGCYEFVGDTLALAAGVSLDQTELNVTMGNTATLVATITPENAALLSTVWKSQFDTIATVVDGVITPVAEGVTTITVTVDGLYKATCTVTVVGAATALDQNKEAAKAVKVIENGVMYINHKGVKYNILGGKY